MNQQSILPFLPSCKDNAISIRELACDMGLETSSYANWIRAERSLSRGLNKLIKWGWVARDRRQRTEGHKFWYSTYWKTDSAPKEHFETETIEAK